MSINNIIYSDWNREAGTTAKQIADILLEPTATDKQLQVMKNKLASLPEHRKKEISNAVTKLLDAAVKEAVTPTIDEIVGEMRFYLGDWFQDLGGGYELDDAGTITTDGEILFALTDDGDYVVDADAGEDAIESSVTLPRNILTVSDAKIVSGVIHAAIVAGEVGYKAGVVTPWKNKNQTRTNARATINEFLSCREIHADTYKIFADAGLTDGALEYGDDRPTYKAYWNKITAISFAALVDAGIPTKRAGELSTAITTIAKSNFKK